MTTDKREILKQNNFSRRRLLQLGGASAAISAFGLPVRRGLAASGPINVYTSAGQRWELPQRAVLPLFNKAFPDITVNIQPVPHSEAVTKAMISMSSKTDAYDVMFTDNGQWPALEAMGALTDLQPYIDQDPAWRDDYLNDVPVPVSNLYRIPARTDGTLYGLTSDGNAQIAFYRTDIFEAKGLKLPTTWDETIEVAKEVTDVGAGQYGFISTMRRGIFSGWQFWAVMASYGGTWFDKEAAGGWKPQFSSEAGNKALEVLAALMPYAHPVTLNATDDEANAALADGSAVFAPIEWGTAVLNDSKFTKFSEVIQAGLTPKGETAASVHAPLMGGLGMFIPSTAKNKDAAWEWIKFCVSGDHTDPAIGEAWVSGAGQPARTSLLNKYTGIRPYFAGLSAAFPVAVPSMSFIPEAQTVTEFIGNEASAALTGEKSIEAALKAMDEGVTRIMAESGYYK